MFPKMRCLRVVSFGSVIVTAGWLARADDAAVGPYLAQPRVAGRITLPSDPTSTDNVPAPDVTAPDSVTPNGATSGPQSPATELTPELQSLRAKVRGALTHYYPKHLNTRDHSPWEVMHGIIAYGVDTQLFRSGTSGEKVNAIGWMCFSGPCRGERMLFLNGNEIVARKGPGLQGHYGQFLAILAQSHLKLDYPMQIGGKQFTIADLVEHEKKDCQVGEELTFKLIGLMHYLDSDETWKSRDGQEWSIQRLVKEELAQPIRGAACGGTHRLMGISYSVNKRIQRGQPIEGEFRRAQTFINDYHRYTFSLQNPDGSFSTEWFTRRGDNSDIDRRIKTTGHIIEWLTFSLSDEDLRHPKMVQAVDYLATLMNSNMNHTWEIGPCGHALHALSIYNRRVFNPHDQEKFDVTTAAAQWRQTAGKQDASVSLRPTAKESTRSSEKRREWEAEKDDGSPDFKTVE